MVRKAQTQLWKAYLDPDKTKAPLIEVKAMKATNSAASLKNLTLKLSESLVVNQPTAKKAVRCLKQKQTWSRRQPRGYLWKWLGLP